MSAFNGWNIPFERTKNYTLYKLLYRSEQRLVRPLNYRLIVMFRMSVLRSTKPIDRLFYLIPKYTNKNTLLDSTIVFRLWSILWVLKVNYTQFYGRYAQLGRGRCARWPNKYHCVISSMWWNVLSNGHYVPLSE